MARPQQAAHAQASGLQPSAARHRRRAAHHPTYLVHQIRQLGNVCGARWQSSTHRASNTNKYYSICSTLSPFKVSSNFLKLQAMSLQFFIFSRQALPFRTGACLQGFTVSHHCTIEHSTKASLGGTILLQLEHRLHTSGHFNRFGGLKEGKGMCLIRTVDIKPAVLNIWAVPVGCTAGTAQMSCLRLSIHWRRFV